MRRLSEEEKKFTRELVRISNTSYDVYLSNIVDRELNNIDIFLDYQNQNIEFRFDQNMYQQNPNDFMYFTRDFSWKMIRYFNLLKDFEKYGMLFLFQETPTQNNSRFGRLANGQAFISSQLNDKDAIKLILEYSLKTILINQSLREYVENDFKTEDDIKHQQNIGLSEENLRIANNSLKIANQSLDASKEALIASKESLKKANITIWVTIGIFVIATIINLLITFRNPEPIKLNIQQLNELKKNQDDILLELKNTKLRIEKNK